MWLDVCPHSYNTPSPTHSTHIRTAHIPISCTPPLPTYTSPSPLLILEKVHIAITIRIGIPRVLIVLPSTNLALLFHCQYWPFSLFLSPQTSSPVNNGHGSSSYIDYGDVGKGILEPVSAMKWLGSGNKHSAVCTSCNGCSSPYPASNSFAYKYGIGLTLRHIGNDILCTLW